MRTMWDAAVRQSFQDRADRLAPTTSARWGRLTAAGALAHLNDSYRMAVGELQVAGKWLPFRYPPLRQMVVYLMPVPKGAPTAPELLARTGAADMEIERRDFHAWMERLGHITSGSQLTPHPAFGHLSHREYGVLLATHTAHHLTQFGV